MNPSKMPSMSLLRFALFSLALTACDGEDKAPASNEPPGFCSGTQLFGNPNATTGLTEAQCTPSCTDCGAAPYLPPTFDDAALATLTTLVNDTPSALLTANPYAEGSAEPIPEGSVCALSPTTPGHYRLDTFASASAARDAGAEVTHTGVCGQCSSLNNLAVYIAQQDLTEPVRACGLLAMRENDAAAFDCLLALGFDEPCAQIWQFNTKHTQLKCLGVCLAALDDPYHLPDGSLNPCLVCDEVQSGPVFKAVAGRTRRNSGLPNALCRPCSEVTPLEHSYAFESSLSGG
jgi:hypothetical protein